MCYKNIRKVVLIVLFLIFFLSLYGAGGAELPSKFIQALHMAETDGRLGPIVGDNGQSLGPFQITYAYWLDAGVKGSYKQVADYDYAVLVVNAYLRRYGSRFNDNYEALARIHNGGPTGYKKPATKKYWLRVKKHLTP